MRTHGLRKNDVVINVARKVQIVKRDVALSGEHVLAEKFLYS